MPLYEYRCKQCGHTFEKIQSFSAPEEKECPVCHGEVERLISAPAIQFKGAGWYVNDYAGKSSKPGGSSPDVGAKPDKASSSEGAGKSSSDSNSAGNSSSSGNSNSPGGSNSSGSSSGAGTTTSAGKSD